MRDDLLVLLISQHSDGNSGLCPPFSRWSSTELTPSGKVHAREEPPRQPVRLIGRLTRCGARSASSRRTPNLTGRSISSLGCAATMAFRIVAQHYGKLGSILTIYHCSLRVFRWSCTVATAVEERLGNVLHLILLANVSDKTFRPHGILANPHLAPVPVAHDLHL